jgi:hypothetical protein
MRRYVLFALCLIQTAAVSAEQAIDPADTDGVVIETYVHYFTVKEMLQQCESTVPVQAAKFSKAFSVWEERNKADIVFVKSAFATRFAPRPKEQQELIDAAPMIAHERYKLSPIDEMLCMNAITTLNTFRVMDYSLRFHEHFEILHARLGGAPS